MAVAIRRPGAVVHPCVAERFREQVEAPEVLVVPRLLAGEHGMQRVVPLVRPDCVDAVPARVAAANDARVVAIALGQDEQRAAGCRRQRVDLDGECFEQVHRGVVGDGMYRIEPQSVDVIVAQPHQRVVDHVVANFVASGAVEVQRRAPVRTVAVREVRTELGEVVARGSEVVVHDVEHHADAVRVARVDEALQAVGSAIRVMGRVEVDAVVAPPAASRELHHGHQLDRVDAEGGEMLQPPGDTREGACGCERADVELVQHCTPQRCTAPTVIGPCERVVVHHLGQAVDPVGLRLRARVGSRLAAVERVAVALAWTWLGSGRVPPAARPRRHFAPVPVRDELHPARGGGPHGELTHRAPAPRRETRPGARRRRRGRTRWKRR